MNSPLTPTTATPERPADAELDRQREAIAVLGRELRTLIDDTVRTVATPDTLHRVADGVRALAGQLTGRRRAPAEIPEVDEFPGGVRMYSPVTGVGSPLAPPMQVTPAEDGLTGQCVLGIAHEGPPGYGHGHGGISAMLLSAGVARSKSVRQPRLPAARKEAAIEHLRDMWHALVRADNLFGPRHALTAVHQQLDVLQGLLDDSRGEYRHRHEVLKLSAQYAESAAWLHEDSMDVASAETWTSRAMEWAMEAGDEAMLSWTLFRRSQLAAGKRNAGQAIGLTPGEYRGLLPRLPACRRVLYSSEVQQPHQPQPTGTGPSRPADRLTG